MTNPNPATQRVASSAPSVIPKIMEDGALEVPNTEVRPGRRRFTAEYKRRILSETDSAKHGGIGTILRREGLTYTHLIKFREQLNHHNLVPQKVGRKPKSELEREIEQLLVRNSKLEHELEKANIRLEYQKKLAILLGDVKEKQTL